ncbi:MAG: helix-turn-helix transcriptional regulator, partial [Clostridia bacterium]|nr:helix-turn-helix transcriptional regulator [Clostridia bacterium]
MAYLHLGEPSLRVGEIWVSEISRPSGHKHTFRKGRAKHGFIYTVSGQMRDVFVSPRADEITSKTGELLFIPMGTVYTGLYQEENTQIRIVQFDLLSGALPPYLSKPRKIVLPNASELIESFFEPRKRAVNQSFYLLSRLYELLWRIDENEARIPARFKRLSPALFELHRDWNLSLPISHYAELCDLSQVHFRRLFKEYTGHSPVDYRNELRLEAAKSRLQSG